MVYNAIKGSGQAQPRKGDHALCAAHKLPFFYTGRAERSSMEPTEVVSTASSLISTVGFPIVCVFICLYLIWSMNNKYNTQTEKWMEIINNNTAALNTLVAKLEKEEV